MATNNGYDQRWIDAINGVLADREVPIRLSDLDDGFWESFVGPMVDHVENYASEPRDLRSFDLDPSTHFIRCHTCKRYDERLHAWTVDGPQGRYLECRYCGADAPGGEFALCECEQGYAPTCPCQNPEERPEG